MEAVEASMGNLITAIENSSIYQGYLQHKEAVMQYPEIRAKINEYRSRNYALQHTENIDLFYELEALEAEYKDFLNQEMVQKYLEAELAVCRLMQKVSSELAGSIDLDLDELTL